MIDNFGMPALCEEITQDEGRTLYPYFDTALPPRISIGVGRNLSDRGISADECTMLLRNDIALVIAQLDHSLTWWRDMPPRIQRVLINLGFNMGVPTLLHFPKMLAAMQRQDWPAACAELRDSRWWYEVGERGPRMVARIMGTTDV